MKGPKIVLVGAGSVFFGRQTVWSAVKKEALARGTLALVDTDPVKLATVRRLAERAIEAAGVPLKLETATRAADVLPGADFVLSAFAVEGVELRGLDARLSKNHGITLCSADTIGPGGTMRTLREVPRQRELLRQVERLCPDAWVVNWVNPTTAMGLLMQREFPRLRSFALCDGPHNPGYDRRLLVRAGLAETAEEVTEALRSRVKLRLGGVNHFNWVVELSLDGRDLLPVVTEALKEERSREHHAAAEPGKRTLAAAIAHELARVTGCVPMCVWHTMEYLPFFQGRDLLRDRALAIGVWSVEVRRQWMRDCHKDMAALAEGRRDIRDFLQTTTADHASDIIEEMWTGGKSRWYINTPNGGAVTNLPEDALLELPCVVDMNRVSPLPFGPMPPLLRGWMSHVLAEHELAVEAALTHDRATLKKAFLASMLVQSIPDAEALADELLAAQRAYLPPEWF